MKIVVAFLILITLGKSPYENETYLSDDIFHACVNIGYEYNISPELLMAICEKESSGNPEAINGDCKGLMQVSEYWHKDRMERLMVTDIYDPWGNILVGTDYLRELFEQYEDVGLVLDIYNGNANAFENYEKGIASEYASWITEREKELTEIHERYIAESEEKRNERNKQIRYSRYEMRTIKPTNATNR